VGSFENERWHDFPTRTIMINGNKKYASTKNDLISRQDTVELFSTRLLEMPNVGKYKNIVAYRHFPILQISETYKSGLQWSKCLFKNGTADGSIFFGRKILFKNTIVSPKHGMFVVSIKHRKRKRFWINCFCIILAGRRLRDTEVRSRYIISSPVTQIFVSQALDQILFFGDCGEFRLVVLQPS
jgi:hypothetical protein